jgi:hypothetical protein
VLQSPQKHEVNRTMGGTPLDRKEVRFDFKEEKPRNETTCLYQVERSDGDVHHHLLLLRILWISPSRVYKRYSRTFLSSSRVCTAFIDASKNNERTQS